ncbi:MAG: hypothetical protein ACTSPV_13305 [Candidatus Hodarchaeales archaeon]
MAIILAFVFVWSFESLRAVKKGQLKWARVIQDSRNKFITIFGFFTILIVIFTFINVLKVTDVIVLMFLLIIPDLFLIASLVLFLTPRVMTTWEIKDQSLLITEQCRFHVVTLKLDLDRIEKIKIPTRLDYAAILCGTGRIEFWYKNTYNFTPEFVTHSVPRKGALFIVSFLIRFLQQYPDIKIQITIPFIYKIFKASHFLEKTDFKVSDWLERNKTFIANLSSIKVNTDTNVSELIKELNILPHYYKIKTEGASRLVLTGIDRKTQIMFGNKRFQRALYLGLLIPVILVLLGVFAIFASFISPDSPILISLFVPKERRELEFPPLYFLLYGFFYVFIGLTGGLPFLSRILASRMAIIQFDSKILRLGRKYNLRGTVWEIESFFSIICDIRVDQKDNDPESLVISVVTPLGKIPFIKVSKDESRQVQSELHKIFTYYMSDFV